MINIEQKAPPIGGYVTNKKSSGAATDLAAAIAFHQVIDRKEEIQAFEKRALEAIERYKTQKVDKGLLAVQQLMLTRVSEIVNKNIKSSFNLKGLSSIEADFLLVMNAAYIETYFNVYTKTNQNGTLDIQFINKENDSGGQTYAVKYELGLLVNTKNEDLSGLYPSKYSQQAKVESEAAEGLLGKFKQRFNQRFNQAKQLAVQLAPAALQMLKTSPFFMVPGLSAFMEMRNRMSTYGSYSNVGLTDSSFRWSDFTTESRDANGLYTINLIKNIPGSDFGTVKNSDKKDMARKSIELYWNRQIALATSGLSIDNRIQPFAESVFSPSKNKLSNNKLTRDLMQVFADATVFDSLSNAIGSSIKLEDIFTITSKAGGKLDAAIDYQKLATFLGKLIASLNITPKTPGDTAAGKILLNIQTDELLSWLASNTLGAGRRPIESEIIAKVAIYQNRSFAAARNWVKSRALNTQTAVMFGASGANVATSGVFNINGFAESIIRAVRKVNTNIEQQVVRTGAEADKVRIRNEAIKEAAIFAGLGAATYSLAAVLSIPSYKRAQELGLTGIGRWLQTSMPKWGMRLSMAGILAARWQHQQLEEGVPAKEAAVLKRFASIISGQGMFSAFDTFFGAMVMPGGRNIEDVAARISIKNDQAVNAEGLDSAQISPASLSSHVDIQEWNAILPLASEGGPLEAFPMGPGAGMPEADPLAGFGIPKELRAGGPNIEVATDVSTTGALDLDQGIKGPDDDGVLLNEDSSDAGLKPGDLATTTSGGSKFDGYENASGGTSTHEQTETLTYTPPQGYTLIETDGVSINLDKPTFSRNGRTLFRLDFAEFANYHYYLDGGIDSNKGMFSVGTTSFRLLYNEYGGPTAIATSTGFGKNLSLDNIRPFPSAQGGEGIEIVIDNTRKLHLYFVQDKFGSTRLALANMDGNTTEFENAARYRTSYPDVISPAANVLDRRVTLNPIGDNNSGNVVLSVREVARRLQAGSTLKFDVILPGQTTRTEISWRVPAGASVQEFVDYLRQQGAKVTDASGNHRDISINDLPAILTDTRNNAAFSLTSSVQELVFTTPAAPETPEPAEATFELNDLSDLGISRGEISETDWVALTSEAGPGLKLPNSNYYIRTNSIVAEDSFSLNDLGLVIIDSNQVGFTSVVGKLISGSQNRIFVAEKDVLIFNQLSGVITKIDTDSIVLNSESEPVAFLFNGEPFDLNGNSIPAIVLPQSWISPEKYYSVGNTIYDADLKLADFVPVIQSIDIDRDAEDEIIRYKLHLSGRLGSDSGVVSILVTSIVTISPNGISARSDNPTSLIVTGAGFTVFEATDGGLIGYKVQNNVVETILYVPEQDGNYSFDEKKYKMVNGNLIAVEDTAAATEATAEPAATEAILDLFNMVNMPEDISWVLDDQVLNATINGIQLSLKVESGIGSVSYGSFMSDNVAEINLLSNGNLQFAATPIMAIDGSSVTGGILKSSNTAEYLALQVDNNNFSNINRVEFGVNGEIVALWPPSDIYFETIIKNGVTLEGANNVTFVEGSLKTVHNVYGLFTKVSINDADHNGVTTVTFLPENRLRLHFKDAAEPLIIDLAEATTATADTEATAEATAQATAAAQAALEAATPEIIPAEAIKRILAKIDPAKLIGFDSGSWTYDPLAMTANYDIAGKNIIVKKDGDSLEVTYSDMSWSNVEEMRITNNLLQIAAVNGGILYNPSNESTITIGENVFRKINRLELATDGTITQLWAPADEYFGIISQSTSTITGANYVSFAEGSLHDVYGLFTKVSINGVDHNGVITVIFLPENRLRLYFKDAEPLTIDLAPETPETPETEATTATAEPAALEIVLPEPNVLPENVSSLMIDIDNAQIWVYKPAAGDQPDSYTTQVDGKELKITVDQTSQTSQISVDYLGMKISHPIAIAWETINNIQQPKKIELADGNSVVIFQDETYNNVGSVVVLDANSNYADLLAPEGEKINVTVDAITEIIQADRVGLYPQGIALFLDESSEPTGTITMDGSVFNNVALIILLQGEISGILLSAAKDKTFDTTVQIGAISVKVTDQILYDRRSKIFLAANIGGNFPITIENIRYGVGTSIEVDDSNTYTITIAGGGSISGNLEYIKVALEPYKETLNTATATATDVPAVATATATEVPATTGAINTQDLESVTPNWVNVVLPVLGAVGVGVGVYNHKKIKRFIGKIWENRPKFHIDMEVVRKIPPRVVKVANDTVTQYYPETVSNLRDERFNWFNLWSQRRKRDAKIKAIKKKYPKVWKNLETKSYAELAALTQKTQEEYSDIISGFSATINQLDLAKLIAAALAKKYAGVARNADSTNKINWNTDEL